MKTVEVVQIVFIPLVMFAGIGVYQLATVAGLVGTVVQAEALGAAFPDYKPPTAKR